MRAAARRPERIHGMVFASAKTACYHIQLATCIYFGFCVCALQYASVIVICARAERLKELLINLTHNSCWI